jgi:trafficking protein particle complex subunit 6
MAPDTNRLTDDISIMKYICKEFWISIFGKQIDNLRTNNSGIFVLQDNNFKLLSNFTNQNCSSDMSQNVN